ncbi:jg22954 [Pararge aegeria aegeria]|uniref:Jg22954 protein n=1 Tax=Pararge aegeria aegeria TaxID=348720 RepID=A0A8S4QCS0_9NEOP|nr:jg22954 [Pararge aegeria aegeria]
MAEISRSEILDSIQKKKEQDKEQTQSPSFQPQLAKPVDKQQLHTPDVINANISVTQHVPTQLLSPSHGAASPVQSKEDSKDKTIKPKSDKKDEGNKNSITITRTLPKQSPGGSQGDKSKVTSKPTKRPLQYLETLAEKAGITFEDKYEAANTLLALDKQNNTFRRPELKQPKSESENHTQGEDYRFRNQKEEDDKLQIQQQIIQQQQQQQLQQLQQQQLQQLQQQHLQQLQQQALQRQHQAIQQHLKNQQDQQELVSLL